MRIIPKEGRNIMSKRSQSFLRIDHELGILMGSVSFLFFSGDMQAGFIDVSCDIRLNRLKGYPYLVELNNIIGRKQKSLTK